jgi:hypothetical protein
MFAAVATGVPRGRHDAVLSKYCRRHDIPSGRHRPWFSSDNRFVADGNGKKCRNNLHFREFHTANS